MYAISFNKGKDIYRADNLSDKDQVMAIVDRLNQKTWDSVVGRMKDEIIEKMNTTTALITRLTENRLEEWGYEITLDYQEKIKRFNMLSNYLYFFNLRYPTQFISV